MTNSTSLRNFEAELLPMLARAAAEARPSPEPVAAFPSARIRRGIVVAAAAALALVVVVPMLSDDPLRGALAVERHGDMVHVSVEDASADPEAMTNELRALGLPANVEVVAVSPSLEGTWVDIVNDNLSAGYNDPRISDVFQQITNRPSVLKIPDDFSTPFTLVVGRPAEPGERYNIALEHDVDDAFHCLGLEGMTPDEAEAALTSNGYEVVWYYEHSDMPYSEIVEDTPSDKEVVDADYLGPTTVGVHVADAGSEHQEERPAPPPAC